MGKERRKDASKTPTNATKAPLASSHVVVDLGERALWTPTLETAVSLLLLPRVASALLSPIADCDETFNYWEPVHFLLHDFGFQTWEYSPAYALRSYLYLGLHVVVARATQLAVWLGVSTAHAASAKLLVFYGLRGALGLACAYCEALFYRSTIPHFGRRTARYLLLFLLFNAGLFHASTALLPSSFVMYLIMLLLSAWMDGRHFLGIFYGVVAVLCGWPYVGVLFLPFMVDTLLARGLVSSLLVGAALGGVVLAAEVGVNFYYYQKLVLPAWQIVQYNVLSSETDSTLYGTEPLSFYLLNLALNFNVAAVLAVPALAMVPLLPPSSHAISWQRRLVYLSPLFIWLSIMFSQAHKEERFLSPVYPLVCLAAAITLSAAVALIQRGLRPGSAAATLLVSVLVYGTLGAYSLLSVSRVTSNVINFQAPLRVYHHLAEHVLPSGATGVLHRATPPVTTLCVGKEWYRFPTSFFLPSNATQVHFLKSAFRGLLPKPFEQHAHATSIVPSHMNNRNQEEPSRYVELRDCDYVVDLNLPEQQETKFWELPDQWELVYAAPFLNADASKSPFRSFYVPLLTPHFTRFADYAVYKQKRS